MILAIVPWVLSGWTLLTTWLAGNGTKWAWVSGIASQFLWLFYVLSIHAYGLLPLTGFLFAIYVRNLKTHDNRALRTSPIVSENTATVTKGQETSSGR